MKLFLKRMKWIAAVALVTACVDPIEFDAPLGQNLIFVDGMISDDPGPYTVKLFRGVNLDADTSITSGISGAKITLHSDEGESEPFTEVASGRYQTSGTIHGAVGTSYYIDLQMPDGATFTSEPEKILPSGHVTSINYQYEKRVAKKAYGDVPADVFNIFVDAENTQTDPNSFVRWRFNGTYKSGTMPQYHKTFVSGYYYYKTPFTCSGWEVDPAIGGGQLSQKRDCECCICYVSTYEQSPRLSDNELATGSEFKNIKIVEIPITRRTFWERYRVEIQQMTITKNAYDFLKVIRAQKDGASNLFQSPPGQARGNIRAVNADYEVIGLFWGASINRKAIYINKSELPYGLPADTIVFPCTQIFANSTTTKPSYWDE